MMNVERGTGRGMHNGEVNTFPQTQLLSKDGPDIVKALRKRDHINMVHACGKPTIVHCQRRVHAWRIYKDAGLMWRFLHDFVISTKVSTIQKHSINIYVYHSRSRSVSVTSLTSENRSRI